MKSQDKHIINFPVVQERSCKIFLKGYGILAVFLFVSAYNLDESDKGC